MNNNTEAAVIVMNGGELTLSNTTITKTYDTTSAITTSGTTSSIPSGIGSSSAGVYVGANSSATLTNVDIDTAINEGKALVAYGSDAPITYATGIVTTAMDNSHG